MKKNLLAGLATGVFIFGMVGIAEATLIVSAQSATSNMPAISQTSLNYTYNQSGLSSNYTTGVTDFDSFVATATHQSIPSVSDFGSATKTGFVEYDLGEMKTIDSMAFWNFAYAGVTSNAISAFTLSSGGTVLGEFNPLIPSSNPTLSNIFTFNQINAQLFRLDITANNGGAFSGFGEVAFGETESVPEPASMLLYGVGLAGTTIRRKKKA